MTSSLVGSEMCIRDRPIHVPRARRRDLDAGLSPIGAIPSSRLGRRIYAVSYTHLTLPTICSV
eukprot:12188734-Prorocentrum_lima.AAC.1